MSNQKFTPSDVAAIGVFYAVAILAVAKYVHDVCTGTKILSDICEPSKSAAAGLGLLAILNIIAAAEIILQGFQVQDADFNSKAVGFVTGGILVLVAAVTTAASVDVSGCMKSPNKFDSLTEEGCSNIEAPSASKVQTPNASKVQTSVSK
jgi:hypothetical protein